MKIPSYINLVMKYDWELCTSRQWERSNNDIKDEILTQVDNGKGAIMILKMRY
jgi:hypothetical protein